jgi:hypothetical protein
MGCFSFMCKECNEPVNSDSFSGELVHLFLLKDGKPIDYMKGQYNSYGRVFAELRPQVDDPNIKHHLGKSYQWKLPWSDVCDLMSSQSPEYHGMAAIHDRCTTGVVPTTRSEDDEYQGWGNYEDISAEEICINSYKGFKNDNEIK